MRSVTLATAAWLSAAAALRRLNSTEGQPAGLPLPPFASQLKLASTLRTIATIEFDHSTQRSRMEASHALRDEHNVLVPVVDPNGNRQNGSFYVDDIAKVNEAISEMVNTPVTKDIDLSLDDVVYCGARRMPDVLPAIAPLLDGALTLSPECETWLVTYDAALEKARVATVPPNAVVSETAP